LPDGGHSPAGALRLTSRLILLNNKKQSNEGLKSLPKILRRVAYPVEPLSSCSFRTTCRRLCWTAFATDWGSKQACLTTVEDGQGK